jgi:ABC-type multidrug transport system fused ATPase/permease subunit
MKKEQRVSADCRFLSSVMPLRSGFCFLLRALDGSATMPSVAENGPGEKPLRSVSFAVHATRGVIRDQTTRRKTMFVLLVTALVLLFLGSTFLAPLLNPREHLGWALTFWIVCVWLTLTALLLALFDVLILRAAARRAQRALRESYARNQGAQASAASPNDKGL